MCIWLAHTNLTFGITYITTYLVNKDLEENFMNIILDV